MQEQFYFKSASQWLKLAPHASNTDGSRGTEYAIKMSAAVDKAREWLQDQMERVFATARPGRGAWCVWKSPDYKEDPYFEARIKDLLQNDEGTALVLELFDDGDILEEAKVRLVGADSRKFVGNARRLCRHGTGRGTVVEKACQDAMAQSIEEEERRVERARARFDEEKSVGGEGGGRGAGADFGAVQADVLVATEVAETGVGRKGKGIEGKEAREEATAAAAAAAAQAKAAEGKGRDRSQAKKKRLTLELVGADQPVQSEPVKKKRVVIDAGEALGAFAKRMQDKLDVLGCLGLDRVAGLAFFDAETSAKIESAAVFVQGGRYIVTVAAAGKRGKGGRAASKASRDECESYGDLDASFVEDVDEVDIDNLGGLEPIKALKEEFVSLWLA